MVGIGASGALIVTATDRQRLRPTLKDSHAPACSGCMAFYYEENAVTLQRKIAGNWHKLAFWGKENCLVAHKSAGLLLHPLCDEASPRYIPFYGLKEMAVLADHLHILVRDGRRYMLAGLQSDLEGVENTSWDIEPPNVPLEGLKLREEPRACACNNAIIVCAYKQDGIDFFSRESGNLISHFDFPGYSFVDDVLLHQNSVYVADVFGLRILDISNVDKPSLDDSRIFRGWPKDVALTSRYVFVADVLGVKIFDKTRDFELAGKYETNKNRVAKVALKDDLAFLACEARGVKVLDIADVTAPKLISGLLLSKGAWDLAVWRDYLYVAAYSNGVLRVDYGNVKTPATDAKFTGLSEVIGIEVHNRAVFAACSYDGLAILRHDLTLRSHVPVEEGRCWATLVRGNCLFAACGEHGVLVLDITEDRKSVV